MAWTSFLASYSRQYYPLNSIYSKRCPPSLISTFQIWVGDWGKIRIQFVWHPLYCLYTLILLRLFSLVLMRTPSCFTHATSFDILYSPDVELIHRMDRVHLVSESRNEDLKDALKFTCPESTDSGRLALVVAIILSPSSNLTQMG